MFRTSRFRVVAVALASMVAGCASDNAGDGKQAAAMGNGSCQETRREIDKLDRRGVPSRIEAANQGKKLSSAQQAEVDQYNRLLQQYLGGRCHL